jgi:hypothetical protein
MAPLPGVKIKVWKVKNPWWWKILSQIIPTPAKHSRHSLIKSRARKWLAQNIATPQNSWCHSKVRAMLSWISLISISRKPILIMWWGRRLTKHARMDRIINIRRLLLLKLFRETLSFLSLKINEITHLLDLALIKEWILGLLAWKTPLAIKWFHLKMMWLH